MTAYNHRWIIGITGASGTIYARRLVRALIEHVPDVRLEVVVSAAAMRVMYEEDGLAVSPQRLPEILLGGVFAESSERCNDRLAVHDNRNIGASIASGSYPASGMVIVPCSMKTLAAVAHGYGDTLIARAADVTLKERRPLVVVPRETPLSELHLRNMLRLVRLGVCVLPAMPGFYHNPRTIDDLADLLVMRILDQMGYAIDLAQRWRGERPLPAAPPADHIR